MRVGINARLLYRDSIRGFSRYTYELCKALSRRGDVELVLFSRQPVFPRFLRGVDASVEIFEAPKHLLWEQVALPRQMRNRSIDVFHAPTDFGLPAIKGRPYVVTNHGVLSAVAPQFFDQPPLGERVRTRLWRAIAISRSDVIIAVSSTCRDDLVKHWSIDPEKLVVIHEAAGEEFHAIDPEEARREVRSRLGLHRDYVLYVGGLDPWKNVMMLIRAFAATSASKNLDLVIAAERIPQVVAHRSLAEDLRIAERVHFLGEVGEELPWLYNAARVFVFPSVYESFGLPVVEAMSCGCPVIASSRGAGPEVVGADGGLLCDPNDEEALAAAIDTVCGDSTVREHLREGALRRSRAFSWDRTAEETVVAYERALKNFAG